MAENKRVSPWLRAVLYVVAILFLPTFLIQVLRPDALDAKAHRPTVQTVKFSFLLRTGILYEWLRWNDSAIAKFQEAEQYAGNLTDTKYESLQKARARMAETYLAAGRTSDAEQVYAKIVQSSMETALALRIKNNYSDAIPKYEDAERFSQKLTNTRLASICSKPSVACRPVWSHYSGMQNWSRFTLECSIHCRRSATLTISNSEIRTR